MKKELVEEALTNIDDRYIEEALTSVSYTHLRAHET